MSGRPAAVSPNRLEFFCYLWEGRGAYRLIDSKPSRVGVHGAKRIHLGCTDLPPSGRWAEAGVCMSHIEASTLYCLEK